MRNKLFSEEEEDKDKDDDKGGEDEEVEELTKSIMAKLDLKEFKNRVSKTAQSIYGASDLTKNEKVISDFWKAMITGDTTKLKALSEGTAADGGYLIPDEFMAEIIKDLEDPTHMRSLVRVVPMRRKTMNIPTLTSKPKVYWTAENTQKTTTSAEFYQKTLTAHKVAAILYSSEELVEDFLEADLVQEIVKMFSDAIVQEEDRVITVGSGSGEPTGLTNCSISSTTCDGNLSFDNLINLVYSLPKKYRVNATFLMNEVNVKELRKLKDTTGRYIWQDAIAAGQPETVMNYPVVENNNLGEDVIYFGDFKQCYWLGDRRRLTVTISKEAGEAWEHDQIGIRVVERIGGNCVLENAMRVLISIP